MQTTTIAGHVTTKAGAVLSAVHEALHFAGSTALILLTTGLDRVLDMAHARSWKAKDEHNPQQETSQRQCSTLLFFFFVCAQASMNVTTHCSQRSALAVNRVRRNRLALFSWPYVACLVRCSVSFFFVEA